MLSYEYEIMNCIIFPPTPYTCIVNLQKCGKRSCTFGFFILQFRVIYWNCTTSLSRTSFIHQLEHICLTSKMTNILGNTPAKMYVTIGSSDNEQHLIIIAPWLEFLPPANLLTGNWRVHLVNITWQITTWNVRFVNTTDWYRKLYNLIA